MRMKKWLAVLTALCLLCVGLSATFAEELEIVEAAGETPAESELIATEAGAEDAVPEATGSLADGEIPEPEEAPAPEAPTQAAAPEAAEPNPYANDPSDFVIEDGVLKKYNGFDKDVVIPDGVTSIANYAFQNDKNIVSVTIPDGVLSLGYDVFESCEALESVTFPDSTTNIGTYTFMNCSSLKNVRLPAGLTVLPTWTFMSCKSLESIDLPATITSMGSYAFGYCESLKSLTLPAGLLSIGSSAFAGCKSLKSLVIPDGVTTLGQSLFAYCDNLESVTIPASVTSIDRTTFDNVNTTIRGEAGTYAERYANGMGIPFNAPVVSISTPTYWVDDDDQNNRYGLYAYIKCTTAVTAVQKPSDLARDLTWSSSDPSVVTVDQKGNMKGVKQGKAIITVATADGKGKAAQLKVVVPEVATINISNSDKALEIPLNEGRWVYASVNTPFSYRSKVYMPLTWSTSSAKVAAMGGTRHSSDTSYHLYVKGLKPGKATITAKTPDGGKATLKVTVYREDPYDIEIDQGSMIALKPKGKATLTATLRPVGAKPGVTWTSDDPGIAKVSKKGVVTAVKAGETEICAESVNGNKDYILVVVTKESPYEIRLLDTDRITLGVGENLTVKPRLYPANAKTKLTWKSSKPKIATVDNKGLIKPLSKGTSVITVQTDNKKEAMLKVTVKPAPKSVKLDKKGTQKVSLGNSLTLKATLSKGSASALKWTSSNTKVATVNDEGRVMTQSMGTATITVKTFNGCKASVKIKVE